MGRKKTSYTDRELKVFKKVIDEKLESARIEFEKLQLEIKDYNAQGNSKIMTFDDGAGTMQKEQLNNLASRQVQFIKHLENALIRIKNKTYGICRVTGDLIKKERLMAVPHATLSIGAKLEQK